MCARVQTLNQCWWTEVANMATVLRYSQRHATTILSRQKHALLVKALWRVTMTRHIRPLEDSCRCFAPLTFFLLPSRMTMQCDLSILSNLTRTYPSVACGTQTPIPPPCTMASSPITRVWTAVHASTSHRSRDQPYFSSVLFGPDLSI